MFLQLILTQENFKTFLILKQNKALLKRRVRFQLMFLKLFILKTIFFLQILAFYLLFYLDTLFYLSPVIQQYFRHMRQCLETSPLLVRSFSMLH